MFDEALSFVLHATPDTRSRRFGVSQAAYDVWRDEEDLSARDVSQMARREAATLWERDYWRRCGAVTLLAGGRPGLALLVFDASAEHEDPLWSHRYVQAAVGVPCDGLWDLDTLMAISRRTDAELCAAFQRLRAMAARVLAGHARYRVPLTNAGLHGGALPSTGAWPPDRLPDALKRLRRGARRVGVPIDPLYEKGAS